jgi:hypothetical protein
MKRSRVRNEAGHLNVRAITRMIDAPTPELKLWAAVLEQAARDLNSLASRDQYPPGGYAVLAQRWFTNTLGGAAERPGSFLWVCKILDLDPDRARLACWPENGVAPCELPIRRRKQGRPRKASPDQAIA